MEKRAHVKLGIENKEGFFGPGTAKLLEYIDETGSVRLACEEMGISYSKAWKILNRMEDNVGESIISRQRGGADGGQSYLTDYGVEFLHAYNEFNEKVKKYTDRQMKVFLKKIGGEM